jgi:hypothetical protein
MQPPVAGNISIAFGDFRAAPAATGDKTSLSPVSVPQNPRFAWEFVSLRLRRECLQWVESGH